MITDIHTHNPHNLPHAVLSGSAAEAEQWIRQWPHGCFSAGIHPWLTEKLSQSDMEQEIARLQSVASHPQIVAIGETGLDKLRGAPIAMQEELLRHHIMLSEKLGKPLVLHVVKSADRLLAIRRELSPELTQPWIWHGFRGKPQLAAQFTASATPKSPTMISLGEKFNRQTAAAIPLRSLLAETDESSLTVAEITGAIAEARGCTPLELEKALAANFLMAINGSGTEWATCR